MCEHVQIYPFAELSRSVWLPNKRVISASSGRAHDSRHETQLMLILNPEVNRKPTPTLSIFNVLRIDLYHGAAVLIFSRSSECNQI